jgi:hypothetical protein
MANAIRVISCAVKKNGLGFLGWPVGLRASMARVRCFARTAMRGSDQEPRSGAHFKRARLEIPCRSDRSKHEGTASAIENASRPYGRGFQFHLWEQSRSICPGGSRQMWTGLSRRSRWNEKSPTGRGIDWAW